MILILLLCAMLMCITNGSAAVILQDDFETGYTTDSHSNMSALSAQFVAKGWDGIWWDNNSYLEVDTSRSHGGSQSILHYFNADQDRATLYAANFGNTDTLYISYWVYLASNYWFGWSTSGGEQKWGRVFYTVDYSGSYPISQHMYPNGRNGAVGANMEWELNANSTKYLATGYDFSANTGKWIKLEYLYIMNTPGSADGTLMFWVDGVKQNIYSAGSGTPMADNNFIYRTSVSQHFNSAWFLSLNNGTPSPAQQVWFDDFYMSNTNDHTTTSTISGCTLSGVSR